MNTSELIQAAQKDGIELIPSSHGAVKIKGEQASVQAWHAVLQVNKHHIAQHLQGKPPQDCSKVRCLDCSHRNHQGECRAPSLLEEKTGLPFYRNGEKAVAWILCPDFLPTHQSMRH